MIELLAAIAIIALLVATVIWGYVTVTQWARTTADRQVLTTLNDALTRYKTQGGNVNALTAGTNISALLQQMRTGVNWSGQSVNHQFLTPGATYPARSISAMGAKGAYQFYRYNTYTLTTPGAGTPTSSQPYGSGTGYIAVNSNSLGFDFTSSTGYIAVKPASGATVIWTQGARGTPLATSSATFWACASAVSSTPSGSILGIDDSDGSVTAVDISGLTDLQSVSFCNNTSLTSLNLSGLSALTDIAIDGSGITSLAVQNLSGLQTLSATSCPSLTSFTLSNCPTLTDFYAGDSALTSLSISNMTSLTLIDLSNNALNASALNSVFGGLSTFAPVAGATITTSGNPGAGSATNSIATAKNWTVN